MAEIRRYPFVRHLRADASSQVLHYRHARLRHNARGASFWFDPLGDSIAEVPLDDRELAFIVQGRSHDYQDVTAQGTLGYRFADAERAARRYDFTIDLVRGTRIDTPLEKIEAMLSGLVEQYAQSYLARADLRDVLIEGAARSRATIDEGLRANSALEESGIAIVSVRMRLVRPSADVEKAIEAPTRERIKSDADEAAFGRRALAVEKERAIAENELQNRIELAKREEHLIAQEGENERNKARHAADAAGITAESDARNIQTVDGARLAIERAKVEAYSIVPPAVMLGLAAREFAGKVDSIGTLTLTPDLVGPYLANVLRTGRDA